VRERQIEMDVPGQGNPPGQRTVGRHRNGHLGSPKLLHRKIGQLRKAGVKLLGLAKYGRDQGR
jgi:hypothetical protein